MEALKLHDALVFLVAAGIVIPIAKRFRISPVLSFLLVGLAVGPYGVARFAEQFDWLRVVLITDVAGVHALGELGVVFLLFMIGLELSLERLWALRRLVFGMGSTQIVLTAVVIGVIAHRYGNTLETSIILGACLALSSTAVVMQLLAEQGRFGTPVGRGSFAVLLAQDIWVVPILFLVGALAAGEGESLGLSIGLALGKATAAVVLILGIGRIVVRPLFRLVSETKSPEPFMAMTLLVIITTAALTHAAGLSAALGAFLAGLILAETEFRHEIEVNSEPFKGLLLGLFFITVGMGIDLAEVLADPYMIAASVAGLFAIKTVITALIARGFGFGWAPAAEIGLLLGQGGEFAFVAIGLALGLALVPIDTAQFMLIVVSATLFLTPLAARLAHSLGRAVERRQRVTSEPDSDITGDFDGHVVIIGYGRTGRLVAELLDRQQIAHVALDLDATRVRTLRAAGAPVFVGDATRGGVLERLQLHHAIALVVTTDDPDAAHRVVETARGLAPQLPILVRAHDSDHAAELLAVGATAVIPEVLEAALQLGQALLEKVGLPPDSVRALVESQRTSTMHEMKADATTP
ncbi:MAG: potassium transporter TrkA [Gammaproteobacteria bacterium]|nr:potassium transporter TrkA [Gammaproteobacteria bacterium]